MTDADRRDALALRLDLYLERVTTTLYESESLLNAYKLAATGHDGQLTPEGQPYLTRLVETALSIKSNAGDVPTIVASLIIDLQEDTATTREELSGRVDALPLRLMETVNLLFRQAWKLTQSEAETLLVDAFRDRRVAAIFLHGCLANARTLHSVSNLERRMAVARRMLEVYVPAASVSGHGALASDIELLAQMNLGDDFASHRRRFQELRSLLPDMTLPSADAFRELVSRLPQIQPSLPATINLPERPGDREILTRLARIDSALNDYKAPKVADILGGFMGISLKGVWLWAEHLLRLSKRATRVHALPVASASPPALSSDSVNGEQPAIVDAALARALSEGTDSAAEAAAKTVVEAAEKRRKRD